MIQRHTDTRLKHNCTSQLRGQSSPGHNISQIVVLYDLTHPE